MLTTVQRTNLRIGLTGLALVPKYVSRLSHRECAEFVLRSVARTVQSATLTTFSPSVYPVIGRFGYNIEVSENFSIRVWGSEGRPTLVTFSTLLHQEEEGIEIKDFKEDDLKELIDRMVLLHR